MYVAETGQKRNDLGGPGTLWVPLQTSHTQGYVRVTAQALSLTIIFERDCLYRREMVILWKEIFTKALVESSSPAVLVSFLCAPMCRNMMQLLNRDQNVTAGEVCP